MKGMLYCAGSQRRILCRTIFSSLAHSGTTGWMAMTFGTEIDGSQKREPTYFGDLLTLPPAPASVWYRKSLDSCLVYYEVLYTQLHPIGMNYNQFDKKECYFVQYWPNCYKTNDISHFCPPWKCQSISRWWIMRRILNVTAKTNEVGVIWVAFLMTLQPPQAGSKSNTYGPCCMVFCVDQDEYLQNTNRVREMTLAQIELLQWKATNYHPADFQSSDCSGKHRSYASQCFHHEHVNIATASWRRD